MTTIKEGTRTTASETATARGVDMKFEIVVIPVSDVDRAKRFYGSLGWRLDADFAAGDDWRVIQFTPPGSGASVIFGKNVTAAAPGSAQGLYLIVSDIKAARNELLARGVKVGEIFHGGGDVHAGPDEPYLFGRLRVSGPDPEHGSYRSFASFKDPDGNRSPRSRIRTAMAGCSRRSPRDCPDAWTRAIRHSPRRPSLRPRSAAQRPRMASTRSGPAGTMRTGRTGTPTTSSGSRPASRCRLRQRLRTGDWHATARRLAGCGQNRPSPGSANQQMSEGDSRCVRDQLPKSSIRIGASC